MTFMRAAAAAVLLAGAGRAAEPADRIIRLAVHGDPLPGPLLESRLESELGAKIVTDETGGAKDGVLTVTFHATTHELVVSFTASNGPTMTRAITARDRDEEVVEDAALLAGNLARNEAGEIAGPEPTPPSPLTPPSPPVQPAPAPPPPEPEERLPASASLFFPLATDAHRRSRTSSFDFNLVYGRIGGIDGVQLGLVNVVTTENGRGVGGVDGFEFGAIANVVESRVRGFEVAGVLNHVGSAEGVQAAVIANISRGKTHAGQFSTVNLALGNLDGLQVGVVNLAGDVNGFQAGVVNVGRRVRGATIGLVNVADDIDGVPIALVSVTKSGGVHPLAWSGSSGLANAGVRFSTRHTFTTFFCAYHHDFHRDFAGGGLVIGGRVNLGRRFHADIDVSGTYLVAPEETPTTQDASVHEQLVQPRVRLSVGFRPAHHFGVFLGAAAVGQLHATNGWDEVTAAVGPEVFGGVEL